MNLLAIFIVLNIVNVILQTIKSLATVKCGKTIAALANALSYGLYTVVIVYTNADLPLWEKVIIVSLSNLIGVYVVKTFEEKMRKDKLWKVDFTIDNKYKEAAIHYLDVYAIPYNYNEYGKHIMFTTFCQTQKDSINVSKLVKVYNGKYFVSENKGVL